MEGTAVRRVYLVGVAKHSKVLDLDTVLAMALEDVLTVGYPAYTSVPRELEERAYVWSEYARGDDRVMEGGEINRFVAGKMFFVPQPRSRTRMPGPSCDAMRSDALGAKRSSMRVPTGRGE